MRSMDKKDIPYMSLRRTRWEDRYSRQTLCSEDLLRLLMPEAEGQSDGTGSSSLPSRDGWTAGRLGTLRRVKCDMLCESVPGALGRTRALYYHEVDGGLSAIKG